MIATSLSWHYDRHSVIEALVYFRGDSNRLAFLEYYSRPTRKRTRTAAEARKHDASPGAIGWDPTCNDRRAVPDETEDY